MLGINEARISMFIILYSYSPYLCKFLKSFYKYAFGKDAEVSLQGNHV